MKRLTKSMEQALLVIYKEKTIESINRTTLKALKDRGLVSTSNKTTSSGSRHVITNLSLAKQCEEISLDLETIKLSYTGRPEPALLSYYKSLGYQGVSCEGIGILTVLKALMLDKLAELNSFNDREDACNRHLEAQFTILKDKIDSVISTIRATTKDRFISNFQEIITKPFTALEYPELSTEFASALFDAIDKEVFIEVAKKIAEAPYTYRNGWPDLTLIKGQEALFIEVKTSDKLHESQLVTIPEMRQILPFKFSVCKVIKCH